MEIIDSHCHGGLGDGLTGPWDTRAPLGPYLRRADAAGITRTVLFPAFHSEYAVANRGVAAIVASRPGRFYGYAMVNAARDAGRVRQLISKAVLDWGFCGIKVHRHDSRISREVCEAARAFSLPVLYDVMGEVAVVRLLATEYPDVAFIVPHLGSFADDWAAQRTMIEQLAAHPNVYTDTSGIRRFDLLAEAVARAGPAKILFGTDGPWLHPGIELAKVRALKLPADAERLILAGNWLRLTARTRAGLRGRPQPFGAAGRREATCRADRRGLLPDGLLRDRGDPWVVTPRAAAFLR
jgi:predicted TIM-barrel fold metal-dependent hydrolase